MKALMETCLAVAVSVSWCGVGAVAVAATRNSEPASLDADTVEYDMDTGIITAVDNVLMKRGITRVAGH